MWWKAGKERYSTVLPQRRFFMGKSGVVGTKLCKDSELAFFFFSFRLNVKRPTESVCSEVGRESERSFLEER